MTIQYRALGYDEGPVAPDHNVLQLSSTHTTFTHFPVHTVKTAFIYGHQLANSIPLLSEPMTIRRIKNFEHGICDKPIPVAGSCCLLQVSSYKTCSNPSGVIKTRAVMIILQFPLSITTPYIHTHNPECTSSLYRVYICPRLTD